MIWARIFIYVLLIASTFTCLTTIIVNLLKNQNPSEWQYKSTALLVVLLFIFTWVDSGLILDYVIRKGDQEYSISSNALEKIISKNIDNLGLAIGKVYDKYNIVERFDCSKESDTVIFYEDKGIACIKVRLKYQPVENTIEAGTTGFISSPNGDDDRTYVNGFYIQKFTGIGIDELKKIAKEDKMIIEVKYFRKQ